MRTLLKWLLAALLSLLIAASLAIVLAVEDAPRVAARNDVSAADIDRAVAMIRLHDPRREPLGQLRSVPLQERDIDLLVQHAARRWLGADTQVQLQPGLLIAQASLSAPLGRWLNLELWLRQSAELPMIDRLRIGRLPVPQWLARQLLRTMAAQRGLQIDALLPLDYIERVTLGGGELMVSYRLSRTTADRLRAALVPPLDQQRLRAYNERLASIARQAPQQEISLAPLLQAMFALSAERSADSDGDEAAEHRAALLTLTFYANQRPLGLLLPAAYDWPKPRPLQVTLAQRHDFPLHFLISATIAAQAGTPLADAAGLWKELADARHGGSGFSFNDLAADRAGTRFGELAIREPRRLQARLARGVTEADFMPDASDLPEFLPEAEFVARFGGVDGDGYRRLMADIEARIDALALFR